MPDIACKAILRFTSLRFFSFFCWRFAELAWAFTFLKSFYVPQSPVSSSRSAALLTAPRLLGSLQPWGGGGGTLFPENDLALGISCGHFSRTSPLLRLEAPTPTAACPPGARDASVERSARLPPAPGWEAAALPGLPLLRSRRREPGCWIQSLRRVLHFHKRAATRRGRDCCLVTTNS